MRRRRSPRHCSGTSSRCVCVCVVVASLYGLPWPGCGTRGLGLLETELAALDGDAPLTADVAFKLYDTYGFPVDLTEVRCIRERTQVWRLGVACLTCRRVGSPSLQMVTKERGVKVDVAGVEALMQRQREQARNAWTGSGGVPPPDGVK